MPKIGLMGKEQRKTEERMWWNGRRKPGPKPVKEAFLLGTTVPMFRCSFRVTLVTPSLTAGSCSCCQSINTHPSPLPGAGASHSTVNTHFVLISNPMRSGTMSDSSLYSQPGTVPWHILGTQWMTLNERTRWRIQKRKLNGLASGFLFPGGIHSYSPSPGKHTCPRCEHSDLWPVFSVPQSEKRFKLPWS